MASRRSYRRLVGGLAASAVLIGSAGPAFADTVYASAASIDVRPGGSATFTVALQATGNNNNDPAGCNATTATPVTIKITNSDPVRVSVPTGNVSITACDDPTTAAVEGSQTVSVSVPSSTISGTRANLTLDASGGRVLTVGQNKDKNQYTYVTDTVAVNVLGKQEQTPLTVTGPDRGTYGKSYPLTTTGGSGTGAVTFTTSGVCALSATDATMLTITSGTGTCSITGHKAGDGSYNATDSSAAAVVVSKASQATLNVTSPVTGTYGQLLGLASFGGSGSGALSYAASGSACGITSDGKLEIISGADNCSVTVSKAGDDNYSPVTSAPHKVTIGKAAQAPLSITSESTATFGDAISLTTSGGSGVGAVSYSVTGSTACDIPTAGDNAGKLVITAGTGTCSVTATKAADNNYASTAGTQEITVGRKAQAGLAVKAASVATFEDSVELSTSGGSGSGAVTYDVGDSTSCKVVGSTLSITSGTGTCAITATKAADGNYSATTSPEHLISTKKAEAAVSLAGLQATYDGAPHTAGVVTNPAGLTAVSIKYDGSATAPVKAGSYTVTATLNNQNYAGSATGTLTIGSKEVTGAFVAEDKTYDRSEAAKVTPAPLEGVVDGDDVSLLVSNAEFASKNVGDDQTVTGALSLRGQDADNYTLSSPTATAKAAITRLQLTGSFTAENKEYDGNATATVATRSLPGVLGTDEVKLALTDVTFANTDAGDTKTVTAQISLTGTDAGNYALSSTTAKTTAAIRPKNINGQIAATDKVYDGTTSASVTASLPANAIIEGDIVSLSSSNGRFASKDAGTDKRVDADLALNGDDAGNYRLTAERANATANITAAPITVGYSADGKVYDGTTAAVAHNLTVTGAIVGDQVQLTVSDPAFNSKNVGAAKPVTGALALAGDDAGNYKIHNTPYVTADITPKALTASFAASSKVYDGTTKASGVPSLTDKVAGDDVDVTADATFDTKNAEDSKTVTAVFTLTGSDKGNYTVNPSKTSSAAIKPKSLTGAFTVADKYYDGSTAAVVASTTLPDVLAGDQVNLTASNAAFETAQPGLNKTVTAAFTLAGADSSNYSLSKATGTTTATIKTWTVTGFFKPVDSSTSTSVIWNTVKGGSTVPLKWTVQAGTTPKTALSDIKSVTSTSVACSTGTEDPIPTTDIVSTGGTVLRYDATAQQWVFNMTTSSKAGTCTKVVATAADGSTTAPAYFKTK